MMAAVVSPATGQRYGVGRVCRVWGVARSSFYAARRAVTEPAAASSARRGPKPAVDDRASARRYPRRPGAVTVDRGGPP